MIRNWSEKQSTSLMRKLFGYKSLGFELLLIDASGLDNKVAINYLLEKEDQFESVDINVPENTIIPSVTLVFPYGGRMETDIELRFPVLSGGRYDNLIIKFGRDCPATGFSLGVNMILTALERRKKLPEEPAGGYFILYSNEGRKKAFSISNKLKKDNIRTELDISGMDIEKAKIYAKSKGLDKIMLVINEEDTETIHV
jgi:histidyl-tRNA synthetase